MRRARYLSTRGAIGALALALAAGAAVAVQSPATAHESADHLAATPPMGWNSWNAFRKDVSEQLIRDIADSMVSSGMRDAGYQYVVVDGGWRATTRAADGRMQAHPERFPSGMKALADYVHSKGLKFGLHQAVDEDDCGGTSPGTGSAPGDTFADKAQLDAETFASWGVDFLKFDWCGQPAGRPDGMTVKEWKKTTYGAMGDALRATGRDIIYSISEYGAHEPWEWAPEVGAHMWRTTHDIRPWWKSAPGTWLDGVVDIVDVNAPLADHAGPGHWNDPDMLEVGVGVPGETGLTAEEARSHFTMWAVMASPLMAAADLRTMSETTRQIMTNREVIAVNQDPAGIQGRRIRDDGDREVWVKPLANGDRAVVLLNRGARATTITTTAPEIGFGDDGAGYLLRDLWAHTDTFTAGTVSAFVPSHGVAMYRVRPGTPDQAPPATTLAVDHQDGYLAAGRTTEVTTTLTNHGRIAIEDARVRLGVPDGWSAEATTPTWSGSVPPGESVTVQWNVTAARDASPGIHPLHTESAYTYGDDAHPAGVQARLSVRVPPAPPEHDAYLSDLDWLSAENQWGPVERDMSNGERGAGDGETITLNGATYQKGLGVHAPSRILYHLGGNCTRLISDVGVDDEVGSRGSVVFHVIADGSEIFTSDPLTGTSATQTVDVGLDGADTLELYVSNAGDGNGADHADWAGARLRCG